MVACSWYFVGGGGGDGGGGGVFALLLISPQCSPSSQGRLSKNSGVEEYLRERNIEQK